MPIQTLFQILFYPFVAADFFCAKSFFQATLALGDVVTAEDRVVQVVKNGAAVDKFAGSAQMIEP
ncbi:MAG: hypothetical protein ABR82_06725 [Verrucomicrobia subdivision 6 bacterium BACL9 MAG-120507-bin52]|uniref:Uncharacterized protein n=1 Tax=Verrucomicrobia subdivision 6 bacterium BACL9 MAG-120507-bin52 TaxID=1655590 RepID=A0A0R2RHY0_9BACT|nr:MAG: hypothetical protein ABR82_06725 [Verrucomicrobia subdivision 6 bacterium BACL9 MAG-120507-bin52]